MVFIAGHCAGAAMYAYGHMGECVDTDLHHLIPPLPAHIEVLWHTSTGHADGVILICGGINSGGCHSETYVSFSK